MFETFVSAFHVTSWSTLRNTFKKNRFTRCADGIFFAGSLRLIPVFSFSPTQTRIVFDVPLGSTVAFTASIWLHYTLRHYGHARKQGGRQHAASKPPCNTYRFLTLARPSSRNTKQATEHCNTCTVVYTSTQGTVLTSCGIPFRITCNEITRGT